MTGLCIKGAQKSRRMLNVILHLPPLVTVATQHDSATVITLRKMYIRTNNGFFSNNGLGLLSESID